jgi:hypothetical protein
MCLDGRFPDVVIYVGVISVVVAAEDGEPARFVINIEPCLM